MPVLFIRMPGEVQRKLHANQTTFRSGGWEALQAGMERVDETHILYAMFSLYFQHLMV